jgi:hypothetical protein
MLKQTSSFETLGVLALHGPHRFSASLPVRFAPQDDNSSP